jgi:hypothetical protein
MSQTSRPTAAPTRGTSKEAHALAPCFQQPRCLHPEAITILGNTLPRVRPTHFVQWCKVSTSAAVCARAWPERVTNVGKVASAYARLATTARVNIDAPPRSAAALNRSLRIILFKPTHRHALMLPQRSMQAVARGSVKVATRPNPCAPRGACKGHDHDLFARCPDFGH